jgi:hypothetical protein
VTENKLAVQFYELYEVDNMIKYLKKWKMLETNNFYASFINVSKTQIKIIFESYGWSCKKASWTDFELANEWGELILDGTENEPLLHGSVIFYPDNIKVLDQIFSTLNGGFIYEFYDNQKMLILEKKSE